MHHLPTSPFFSADGSKSSSGSPLMRSPAVEGVSTHVSLHFKIVKRDWIVDEIN
jgi:hypothetical protein